MAVDEKRVFTIPMVSVDGSDIDGLTVAFVEEENGVMRIKPSDSDDTFPVRLTDLAEVVRRLTDGPAPDAAPAPTPDPVRRLVVVTDQELRCSTIYVDDTRVRDYDLSVKHLSPGLYAVERWAVRTSLNEPWPDTLAELTRVEEVGT